VQAAESARQQYAQGLHQAAQISAASLFSQFPELTNLNAAQLPTAIEIIAKQDPLRAQAINAAVSRTKALYDASQQAAARQQQLQAAQLQAFVAREDAAFEEQVAKTDSAETIAKVKAAAPEVISRVYGIPAETLAQVWQHPIVRSSQFQKLAYDAVRYHLAQAEIQSKLAKPVPPVMRPGVAMARDENDQAVTSAMKAFREDPSPQRAAELLIEGQ
jgi:hypothetical protein